MTSEKDWDKAFVYKSDDTVNTAEWQNVSKMSAKRANCEAINEKLHIISMFADLSGSAEEVITSDKYN